MMGCRVVLLIEAGSPRLSLSDGHTSMESAPPGCSSLLVPCEDAGLLRGGWLLGTVNELAHKKVDHDAQAKRQMTLDAAVGFIGTTKKLPASHNLQKSFTRYVTEMVALDGLPLSVTKVAGFKRLVEFLKPELQN
ncbi:hypothetical protein MTO96_029613 [Rhipicephalus appendiculatus]